MLEHYTGPVLALAQGTHGWLYLIVLLAALIEALPVIGTLFPGHTLVILSGALVVEGGFSAPLLMLVAVVGAAIGDGIAYLVGRRYGTAFLKRRSPLIRRAATESRRFFDRYGLWGIVIGRFNTLTRAFVPVFAGSARMRQSRFWTANIVGAVLWGVSSILIGIVLGHGYRLLYRQVGGYTLLAIALCAVVWYGYTLVLRRLFEEHPRKALFGTSALCLTLFAALLDAITNINSWLSPIVQTLDDNINVFAMTHNLGTAFWSVITLFGGPFVLWTVVILTIVFVWRRRSNLLLFVSSAGIALALDIAVKGLVARPRPDLSEALLGYSFPSGHALMATAVYGALAILLWRSSLPRSWRAAALWLLPLLVLLVGASRIALNVHWASDAVAGFALGGSILAGALFVQRFRKDVRPKKNTQNR
jgi:membrane protein DedA with SNARE-associated domain/membrane-associated phospholipid phosphatase